jgi:SAM-dependent methyltransferase
MNFLKAKLKEFMPPAVLYRAKLLAQHQRVASSGAEAAFEAAEPGPVWLPGAEISAIEARYEAAEEGNFVSVDYTEAAIARRADVRLRLLRRMLGAKYKRCNSFLETGAADAMIARALMLDGKNVLATDIQDEALDPRVVADRVPFTLMSATNLALPDACIDVLYSFDSMEHMDDPKAAMAEAVRVVRPGGYIYLRFGPLYQSADGMHLGTRLRVPYASVLFNRETIDSYMSAAGREALNHDYCNGWTLDDYRTLFDSYSDLLDRPLYFEHWDLSALDLVRKYPSCFRAKSNRLDTFLVGVIEVLFCRRAV